jgi:hypothetical protein
MYCLTQLVCMLCTHIVYNRVNMSMNVDSLRTLHACLLLVKYYLFSNALICDKKTMQHIKGQCHNFFCFRFL